MKAIIIAAGMGNRLLHLTQDTPKCLLKINNKPIIEHQLEIFKSLGISDISIVKGFLKDQINYPGTKSFTNDDYQNNNILASLMYAESEIDDEVIISYADIIYEKEVVEKLINAPGDVSVVVDIDWKKGYVDRKNHPIEEAENVVIEGGSIKRIGKHLTADESNGEFIGIFKLSKNGANNWRNIYNEVKEKFGDGQFQQAKTFKKAYLTDLLQELIDRNHQVNSVDIHGGWIEIDTIEDLKRAGGTITSTKITPEAKRGLLRNILADKGFARVMEAHNGISAIVASNAVISETKKTFDALWVSSLTESAAKGQPDIEIMGPDSRLKTVEEVLAVSNKPVIIDGDTGGDPNAFEYFIRKAESLGASAVIIEDKVYPKRNSLDPESKQTLEDPNVFAEKIKRGKSALLTDQFMIIARIESFIAGKDITDAISRAQKYLEAGVDGIMIHSKSKEPDEVLEFAKEYKKLTKQTGIIKPLVCVPTTYDSIKESKLQKAGFNIVIYANHSLRASVKAMEEACKKILESGRAKEIDKKLTSVEDLFDLVGFSDIKNKDKNNND